VGGLLIKESTSKHTVIRVRLCLDPPVMRINQKRKQGTKISGRLVQWLFVDLFGLGLSWA
jgi:hypothetical protein